MDDCRSLPPVCNRYQRAAELLGRRWSAAVIRATLEGPARFTEIRGSVDGLSARLLAERLRELESAGLMERRELGGGAVEYRLTPKGAALSRVVHEIEAWVEAWDDAPDPPRLEEAPHARPDR
jgi:DNA-binding HxlR family transcriptional regulator